MTTISQYLSEHGPARSSRIVEAMVSNGVSREAARQRVARAEPPVRKFPVSLLPKREAFLYLEKDRNTERFWDNLFRDLRESGAVFAATIDGMIARGGAVRASEFAVISASPLIAQAKLLSVDAVVNRLIAASIIVEMYDEELGKCYAMPYIAGPEPFKMIRAYDLAERVVLDGMREWARKIGLASYNAIRIRGDAELKPIGPFAFDLAGPSYLLPLQGDGAKPGFVVADVFAEGRLTVHEVQYFIRKAQVLKSVLNGVGILSIIVAESFTGEAIKAGHAAGIMLATPKDLFGQRVGAAIASLVEVLKNAAAYASSSPERLTFLLSTLFEIEGRSKNLRGVLFELVAALLARRDAVSIDMNVKAKDPATGKTAEIDVLKVAHHKASVTAIECKGKEPGGRLSLTEVETWLKKIAIQRAHLKASYSFDQSEHRFEIWTTGTIDADALALLEDEKKKRVKAPIYWKDGDAILTYAKGEKGIADALREHYFEHPLAVAAREMASNALSLVAPMVVAGANDTLNTPPYTPPVALIAALPALAANTMLPKYNIDAELS